MLKAAANFLKQHTDFVLIAHVSPDGDTLGSCLALSIALKSAGKTVRVICGDPMPEKYSFLPEADRISVPDGVPAAEAAVAVDCADIDRMGDCRMLFEQAESTLCIDHHGTNCGYADVNYIQRCGATGELVIRILEELSIPMNRMIGECLYSAISTDTGNFSYNGTTPDTFRMMAKVLESGINLSELNRLLFRAVPYRKVRLETAVLNRMEMYCEGRIGISWAQRADYSACGAREEDSEGIIDKIRDIDSVEAAAFLRECEDGSVKVSLRGKRIIDVSRIASAHQGGGHRLAAGCTLRIPMDEAIGLIRAELEKALGEAE